MVETGTIIESVYLLLKTLGPSDKLKIVKLLYFADKYHLIKYGRTISNDEYWAMYHGPVGSNTKDVLECDELTMSDDESTYAKKFFSKIEENKFQANILKDTFEFNFLSETDIEALEFVINNFGAMNAWEIRNFSHKYPEWAQYKELFENNQTKRERIQTEELISVAQGDPFNFTEEDLREAKNVVNGTY